MTLRACICKTSVIAAICTTYTLQGVCSARHSAMQANTTIPQHHTAANTPDPNLCTAAHPAVLQLHRHNTGPRHTNDTQRKHTPNTGQHMHAMFISRSSITQQGATRQQASPPDVSRMLSLLRIHYSAYSTVHTASVQAHPKPMPAFLVSRPTPTVANNVETSTTPQTPGVNTARAHTQRKSHPLHTLLKNSSSSKVHTTYNTRQC
jgi:hypothetical protein